MADPLSITSVAPAEGPVAGGTSLIITGISFFGSDLGATTAVSIGGKDALNLVVVSDTEITCTTPLAASAGAVDVEVTNNLSESDTAPFTYLVPLDVTAVSPSESPVAGGGTVTITGAGFGSSSTVSIGGVAASDVVVVSDTEITCTVPPHAAGLVDVAVSYGGETALLVDAFKFFDVVGPVASTLLDLLPPGKLWRLEIGSKLRLFLFAIGDELDRVRARIRDLLEETDPRTADETLPEWEAMLSLPDEQVPTLAATTAGRQFAVTQKYVARGGQSESFFRNLLTACGYDGAGAEIITFHDRVLRVGFRANDRVWGNDFCYALQILADPASGDALSSTQLAAVLRKALHSHIVLITEEF